jgi:hypothetical protein
MNEKHSNFSFHNSTLDFITYAKCNLLGSFFVKFASFQILVFFIVCFLGYFHENKKWKEFSFVMLLEAAFMGHPEVFCISSKHGGRKRKSKSRF